jgi:hypothetical protein
MLRKSQALFALSLTLALGACQQQSAPTATPAASATADSVGVPECDDYLNKYQACVDSKVPEAARAALKQSLDQTRGAWRTALANPGAKEGLATACKQARDATRASMSAYGCTDF